MFGWLRRAPAPPTEQQRQVWQALSEYPPYAPPEWDLDTKSLRDANVEYQKYFFDSKPLRLEALRAFLAKFDIALGFDDAGIRAVSAWMPQYADLLVRNLGDHFTNEAYWGFSVPWTGALAGLNPIFDLGIYHAECLWSRRTKLKWIVARGPQKEVSTHFISGLPGTGKLFCPMTWTYVHCSNIRNSKELARKRFPGAAASLDLKGDTLYRHILSKTPPGRRSRRL
ncbi:hypothetical protein [Bradyrhizobium mercantei]|uniref:hypothetical protein n=1 Tax=Bradyrhizobium mercantei TaxID=1904807 RepID=UPI00097654E8|nr:hypothetical protein [Bradyrhizobium mercantei]